ncbi:hypothetical protein B0O80DRAFT_466505 [Mortierella sp. GBAus27b]|nr:hypothetical protein BGX31_006473 [Mortierella sp. GBA43]KAI8346932.1 hypothetical protein B0O80DRAFT_466505 [Mortierella sp. GBAus27b]
MKRANDNTQSPGASKRLDSAQGRNRNIGINSNSSIGDGYPTYSGIMMGSGSGPSLIHMPMVAPCLQYQAPTFALDFQPPFAARTPTASIGSTNVYIGHVSPECTIDQVLDLVHDGLVVSAGLVPEKNCAFVSFVDPNAAAAFHQKVTIQRPSLAGRELVIGWGKDIPIPPLVLHAVQQGATRNVFLGGIDGTITEDGLRADFSKFGDIDTIKILYEKDIALVHLTRIDSAVQAVAALSEDPRYKMFIVKYADDRCTKQGRATFDSTSTESGLTMKGSRTIQLGNLSDDTTCQDVCDLIRGGVLSYIRLFHQKHIAHVGFVEPQAASNFLTSASQGIILKGSSLTVELEENVSALPQNVIDAVQQGASRNVYLGKIDGSFTEKRLRQDFTVFGETELIRVIKEKNYAYVYFTNILSAVNAVNGIRNNDAYANVKVGYGRDRCGDCFKTSKKRKKRSLKHSQDKGKVDNALYEYATQPNSPELDALPPPSFDL